MIDIDAVKRLAPEAAEPSEQAQDRGRHALMTRMKAEKPAGAGKGAGRRLSDIVRRAVASPSRLAVAAGAIVVIAAALVLTSQLTGETAASAAATLRGMASVAAKQQEPAQLASGQYTYMRSLEAHLAYLPGEDPWAVLVPVTREVWLGDQGRVRVANAGEPRFLSQHDHDCWIAAGSPSLEQGMDTSLGAQTAPDLPVDPDQLFDRLKDQAGGAGHGLYLEMFVLVGDNLRGTLASSELRAALYEVAARIPEVKIEGELVDSTGRRGVGVSMDDTTDYTRHTLIIDPATSRLLEERDVVLAGGYELGYPAGTLIGHATYLVTATVADNHSSPD